MFQGQHLSIIYFSNLGFEFVLYMEKQEEKKLNIGHLSTMYINICSLLFLDFTSLTKED